MLCNGVDTIFIKSPSVEVEVEPNPTAVPTPIDSWGLKNTLSFNFESKSSVKPNFISNVFGINSTFVPTVWIPDTAPLLTLKILFWLKVLRTKSFSVPIPILLPTDISDGICETYISVTTPVVAEFGTCWYKVVRAVLTPILWEPGKFTTAVVLKPDITTLSPSLNDGDVDIKADTSPSSLLTKTTLLNVFMVVSIEVISLPFTLSTVTLSPPPSVSVLSKIAELPTW